MELPILGDGGEGGPILVKFVKKHTHTIKNFQNYSNIAILFLHPYAFDHSAIESGSLKKFVGNLCHFNFFITLSVGTR